MCASPIRKPRADRERARGDRRGQAPTGGSCRSATEGSGHRGRGRRRPQADRDNQFGGGSGPAKALAEMLENVRRSDPEYRSGIRRPAPTGLSRSFKTFSTVDRDLDGLAGSIGPGLGEEIIDSDWRSGGSLGALHAEIEQVRGGRESGSRGFVFQWGISSLLGGCARPVRTPRGRIVSGVVGSLAAGISDGSTSGRPRPVRVGFLPGPARGPTRESTTRCRAFGPQSGRRRAGGPGSRVRRERAMLAARAMAPLPRAPSGSGLIEPSPEIVVAKGHSGSVRPERSTRARYQGPLPRSSMRSSTDRQHGRDRSGKGISLAWDARRLVWNSGAT